MLFVSFGKNWSHKFRDQLLTTMLLISLRLVHSLRSSVDSGHQSSRSRAGSLLARLVFARTWRNHWFAPVNQRWGRPLTYFVTLVGFVGTTLREFYFFFILPRNPLASSCLVWWHWELSAKIRTNTLCPDDVSNSF